MKKILFACMASAGLLLAGAARAGTIGFEDVATDGDFASLSDISPYAGLTWSGDWYAGDTAIDGYAGATHSGANFAVNGFGADAVDVSSATGFKFTGAWFATAEGAADKASWVNISAYNAADQLIGTTGNVAIGASYVWVGGGFDNVARLSITRDTGWYVMDDFNTGSVAAPVPEPETYAMLLAGLGLVGVNARRRKAT